MLVILDVGSLDLGTSYELINSVIIPNLGDNKEDHILVAINQCDMAMKGKHWDSVNNKPNATLTAEFLGRLYAYPSRGNFVLVRCERTELKAGIIYVLEEHNIFVRNVSQSESLRECFRVTIGTRKQMQRVIEALKEIIR